jgi:hypothetical protein
MMAQEKRQGGEEENKPRHVGGIDDGLGGVDPEIDDTLMRLSGGP